MSPQPATAPKATTPAERQIARAQTLERQRADLMEAITANRDYLRLMEKNEELEDVNVTVSIDGEDETMSALDWLDDFYPLKEKGERRSADEIERTRKVRLAARKANSDGGQS